MFSRARRVSAQFFRSGFSLPPIDLPSFKASIRKNNLKHSRYGVVLSARIFPQAILRNKIKRLVFKGLYPYNSSGWDVVLYLKKGFDPQNLALDIEKLHNQLLNK